MRLIALSFLAFFAFSQTAHALTAQKQALVDEIEIYLNGLKTLESGFAQISNTGEYADGKVVMVRPGKMRLVYNPPSQTEIIVRNDTIIYHDLEYKQVNYYPLNSTPLAVLLKEELSFTEDVNIIDVAQGPGVVELTMVDKEDPSMGSVSLIFSDKPLTLRKWAVTDAQGIITTVSLLNPVNGALIDPKAFDFEDPDYDKRDN